MYQLEDCSVTSINAIISTIRVDKQVRRWFTHLILQKSVENQLSEKKDVEAAYKRAKNISFWEKVLHFLFFCLLLFVVIARQPNYAIFVIAFLPVSIFLYVKKKECTIKISSSLINADFNEEAFAQKTLYQIGEFYSRKYGVVSLVDAVTSVDVVVRKSIFYTFIFVTFIYPLNFWWTCGTVLAVYWIFYGLISTTFIYGRVK